MSHTTQKPNIVFLFSDQQHWQAMGCIDSSFITPNLDHLASQSVLFENSFCTTPQCSPSRSSLLTGFYPSRTGVMGNVGAAGGDPLKQATVAKPLQDAGFYTGYFGKWHLGDLPVSREGWDEFGIISRGKPERCDSEEDYHPDPLCTGDILEFLENRPEDRPFAVFGSYDDPHDIYRYHHDDLEQEHHELPPSWHGEDLTRKPHIQKEFMDHDQGVAGPGEDLEQWKAYRQYYRYRTQLMDEQVGKILEKLEDEGLLENTIVVFTSDHGDMDAHHRLIWKGPFMYEHMIRVPLLIRLPEYMGGGKARTIKDFDAIGIDLVPTLLDLCGLPIPETDGMSLKPILFGETLENRPFVVTEYYSKQKWVNPIRSIRTHSAKLNRINGAQNELYDLQNDPHELRNLYEDPEMAEVRRDLEEKLDAWLLERKDPFASYNPTTRDGCEIGQ